MTRGNYDAGVNDDYAYMRAGRFSFYVGYEHTICPTHGNDSDCDCDTKEWAFVAQEIATEAGRLPLSELSNGREDLGEVLLRGISRFGNKFWKE